MPDLEVAAGDLSPREAYTLLTGLVVPRPIAWVSTLSAAGVRNLAPHSYFNVVSTAPPIVHFTSSGVKDTLRNVRETGEFVVNIVSVDLAEAMNLTATDFPPAEDEFAWAELDATPSAVVAPPRVSQARGALECRVRGVLSLGNGNMVFGDVVHLHVSESVLRDGHVDPALLRPLGRLGGAAYTFVEEPRFIERLRWKDLQDGAG